MLILGPCEPDKFIEGICLLQVISLLLRMFKVMEQTAQSCIRNTLETS